MKFSTEEQELAWVDEPDERTAEQGYCPACEGSGEGGRYDGSRCSICKGKGVE